MMLITEQMKKWMGEFGDEYTCRNRKKKIWDLNSQYKKRYGITRTELNQEFLGSLDKNVRILEIGSNAGAQLKLLKNMGFNSIYGIEINRDAIERCRRSSPQINIIYGSAFDIPFKDGIFDLVFTSGLLIHIAPCDIHHVLREIYRCTNHYIWGFEYFSEFYKELTYHGHDNILWKNDFARMYVNNFPGLKLVKERRIKYLDSDNIDSMFLLEKQECRKD